MYLWYQCNFEAESGLKKTWWEINTCYMGIRTANSLAVEAENPTVTVTRTTKITISAFVI